MGLEGGLILLQHLGDGLGVIGDTGVIKKIVQLGLEFCGRTGRGGGQALCGVDHEAIRQVGLLHHHRRAVEAQALPRGEKCHGRCEGAAAEDGAAGLQACRIGGQPRQVALEQRRQLAGHHGHGQYGCSGNRDPQPGRLRLETDHAILDLRIQGREHHQQGEVRDRRPQSHAGQCGRGQARAEQGGGRQASDPDARRLIALQSCQRAAGPGAKPGRLHDLRHAAGEGSQPADQAPQVQAARHRRHGFNHLRQLRPGEFRDRIEGELQAVDIERVQGQQIGVADRDLVGIPQQGGNFPSVGHFHGQHAHARQLAAECSPHLFLDLRQGLAVDAHRGIGGVSGHALLGSAAQGPGQALDLSRELQPGPLQLVPERALLGHFQLVVENARAQGEPVFRQDLVSVRGVRFRQQGLDGQENLVFRQQLFQRRPLIFQEGEIGIDDVLLGQAGRQGQVGDVLVAQGLQDAVGVKAARDHDGDVLVVGVHFGHQVVHEMLAALVRDAVELLGGLEIAVQAEEFGIETAGQFLVLAAEKVFELRDAEFVPFAAEQFKIRRGGGDVDQFLDGVHAAHVRVQFALRRLRIKALPDGLVQGVHLGVQGLHVDLR